jgi:hypothetical protein
MEVHNCIIEVSNTYICFVLSDFSTAQSVEIRPNSALKLVTCVLLVYQPTKQPVSSNTFIIYIDTLIELQWYSIFKSKVPVDVFMQKCFVSPADNVGDSHQFKPRG